MPTEHGPTTTDLHTDCDVLVLGSGAGGLSAAVTAAHFGLKVLVLEKAAVLGGTSAWSGGWMWIPHNALARSAGLEEHPSGPRHYLRHELGAHFDADKVDAYLQHGPRMVNFFRHNTALQFIDGNTIPDFHGDVPHAALGGRSVCAAPFDGRELGTHIHALRAPLDMGTLWGMGIAAGADLRHFLQALRHWASFKHVLRRMLRHGLDLLRHGRGLQLVAGNALVARLLKSAVELGVDWRTGVQVERLTQDPRNQRVTGAQLRTGEIIQARLGVVLACGGGAHDSARHLAWLPYASNAQAHWGATHFSAAPKSNTGDGLRLGESVGAVVHSHLHSAMAHAPVSLAPRGKGWDRADQQRGAADDPVCRFPHLIDRGKPGLLAVTLDGERFCNEGQSYNDFMQALFKTCAAGQLPTAWLLVDHRFLRRYGLGAVKPAPFSIRPWLRNGYLKRGRTLAELAAACGLPAVRLQASVEAYNRDARQGADWQFARGSTPYTRMQGDANQGRPNPAVAPMEQAPFYAVQIFPGSLGAFAGLHTNAHAQALNAHGQPIAGLYACGNDMASIMGGHYPSGGITLGPAMTFGHVAALHVAGRLFPKSSPTASFAATPVYAKETLMYYELAMLTLPFGTAAQAALNIKRFCDEAAEGELLGCWFSDIGVLNQMIVLRGFASLDALRAERQRTQQHVSPFGCGDFCQSLEQHSYQGFGWMMPVRPSSESGISGPVYEIRTYGIKPGGVQGTVELWQQAMPAREKLSRCVVAMVAMDGPLRFTNIWAYESLNARSKIRAEAVALGAWPPKGGPALLTTTMTSTIAMPTSVSPLK